MHWGLDNDDGLSAAAQIYTPAGCRPGRLHGPPATGFATDIALRAEHPDTAFPEIQRALTQMNAQQMAYGPETMEQFIADSLAARRFS